MLVHNKGYILRKFKNTEYFLGTISLGSFTIYVKINFYTLIKKYSRLKNSSLSAHYFKNIFKIIKLLCKKNRNEFGVEEENSGILLENFCSVEKLFFNC